eukprot:1153767-Pelagomonas_calceolata.AAC.5
MLYIHCPADPEDPLRVTDNTRPLGLIVSACNVVIIACSVMMSGRHRALGAQHVCLLLGMASWMSLMSRQKGMSHPVF